MLLVNTIFFQYMLFLCKRIIKNTNIFCHVLFLSVWKERDGNYDQDWEEDEKEEERRRRFNKNKEDKENKEVWWEGKHLRGKLWILKFLHDYEISISLSFWSDSDLVILTLCLAVELILWSNLMVTFQDIRIGLFFLFFFFFNLNQKLSLWLLKTSLFRYYLRT